MIRPEYPTFSSHDYHYNFRPNDMFLIDSDSGALEANQWELSYNWHIVFSIKMSTCNDTQQLDRGLQYTMNTYAGEFSQQKPI